MKLYHNLFAYLNQTSDEVAILAASDRPILVLNSQEILKDNNPLLIKRGDSVYEVGFPYINPTDLAHQSRQLLAEIALIVSGEHKSIKISDQVIDQGAIEDEKKLEEWGNSDLGKNIDKSVGLLLQIFNNLLGGSHIWHKKQGNSARVYVTNLNKHLAKFNFATASLPLIVTLERRYELTRKLREITPKLRYQLRRQAELVPLGRIQEMDSYCLRDYTRRPGRNPEEKAGSRQELMAIQRHLDYNTLENQFLVYFAAKILHFECFCYEEDGNQASLEVIKKLRQTIDIFKKQPTVKNIYCNYFKLNKPNYVLQQNQIYSSFYRAYLDYVYKRTEKQNLWSFRNALWGDVVYLCLVAALLSFQGVLLEPLVYLQSRTSPDQGNYLYPNPNKPTTVKVVLPEVVYELRLEKNTHLALGDYCLSVEIHNLYSKELTTVKKFFPLWIFWYQPTEKVISAAQEYMKKKGNYQSTGILIYLQTPPNVGVANCVLNKTSDKLWLVQIANPLAIENFQEIVKFLAVAVIKALAEVT